MIVKLQQGLLQGVRDTSLLSGKTYYTFLGIPYGKPPVGELRFQPPVPVDPWNGVFRATKEPNCCMQKSIYTKVSQIVGSEDCLYLNVYTPDIPLGFNRGNLKPVMVYFHGGAFYINSSTKSSCSADFLINEEVIIVSMNYRLHVFGFLNLGIPGCEGNCGLKDQLLALQWIKENIKEFGGDPRNVTIFGNSSGSCSVSWHVISPMSRKRGLFHKAIMQNGTALTSNAFVHNPITKAFLLASRLGYDGDNRQEILNFLLGQSAEKLTNAVFDLYYDEKEGSSATYHGFTFIPSLEITDNESFISDLPENLIQRAKSMPTIAGFTDQEGIIVFRYLTREMLQEYDKDFCKVLKRDCTLNLDVSPLQLSSLGLKLKKYYYGDKHVSWETKELFMEVTTDIKFLRLYDSFNSKLENYSPLYVYEFAFDGKLNFNKQKFLPKESLVKGACHSDELFYLLCFREHFDKTKISVREKKMIECMCNLWTNFAKFGNPTPNFENSEKWLPSTKENPYYLRIDEKLQLISGKLRQKQQEFWRKTINEATSK